jgi:beta-glucosidase
VRVPGQATAFPAPVSLAATFSGDLAKEWGQAVGLEGAAHGQNVLLAPMTNIVRAPLGGRNFETLGEDPLLASRMVAGIVSGLQQGGMIATVKHWAANNQETERQRINVKVDERALREIEMPAFRAAVEAGAGALMCSYNQLNGAYACENSYLLTDVLRTEWGYAGFVMSDWNATRSTARAINAGLDMEMPNGRFFGTELEKAATNGDVSIARIDQSVRRILTQMDRVGLLSGTRPRPAFVAHPELARAIANKGAVLPKNKGAFTAFP